MAIVSYTEEELKAMEPEIEREQKRLDALFKDKPIEFDEDCPERTREELKAMGWHRAVRHTA